MQNAQQKIDQIVNFIQKVYQDQHFDKAVIAVSGGLDSAVSLTLLAKALPKEQIYPLFLPFAAQEMEDAREICEFNQIPQGNWDEINIQPMVDILLQELMIKKNADATQQDLMRAGNIMARMRMIVVFDQAKNLEALVCGTENKSESMLGYFSRFGDGASDVEPIKHLFKTEVRQLAEELGISEKYLTKPPSAGLWAGQTDEQEMGFKYSEADQVLAALEAGADLSKLDLQPDLIAKITTRVKQNAFKHEVPYCFMEK